MVYINPCHLKQILFKANNSRNFSRNLPSIKVRLSPRIVAVSARLSAEARGPNRGCPLSKSEVLGLRSGIGVNANQRDWWLTAALRKHYKNNNFNFSASISV